MNIHGFRRFQDTSLYEQIKNVVPARIHPIANVGHEFGVEQSFQMPLECAEWPIEADAFMMEYKGFSMNRGIIDRIF